MKIVWHKHNVMISSFVGSGHPVKCSYEIPLNTYQSEGTSRVFGGFFSSNGDFFSPICCDFFRTVLILEKLLLHTFSELVLRHNSYFFGVAISSEQLVFFWEALFSEHSLFSKQLFFQNNYFSRVKLLPSSHFLRIESSLG